MTGVFCLGCREKATGNLRAQAQPNCRMRILHPTFPMPQHKCLTRNHPYQQWSLGPAHGSDPKNVPNKANQSRHASSPISLESYRKHKSTLQWRLLLNPPNLSHSNYISPTNTYAPLLQIGCWATETQKWWRTVRPQLSQQRKPVWISRFNSLTCVRLVVTWVQWFENSSNNETLLKVNIPWNRSKCSHTSATHTGLGEAGPHAPFPSVFPCLCSGLRGTHAPFSPN